VKFKREGKQNEKNNFFRKRVGSFYRQNIFLEIVGGCYKNKT